MPCDIELLRLAIDLWIAIGRPKQQHDALPCANGTAVDLHIEDRLVALVRPNALRRCLVNLVSNAARFASQVWIRAGQVGDMIEITVDDDGPGIPAARREDVFKPFFRLEGSRNPRTGGTGLGLTIARDVIRSHGGDLVLLDAPTGGLRARLSLPL